MTIYEENRRIFEDGFYRARSGRKVPVGWGRTRLYVPSQLALMLDTGHLQRHDGDAPTIEVVEGKTGDTARAVADEAEGRVALLNFASARNAGGGYKRGATAQEEDLCRCSALYPSLLELPRYYEANRGQKSMLYTDHMIVSEDVSFFRDDKCKLLHEAASMTVITAPAPNAGEFLSREADPGRLEETLRRRAGYVLALAEAHEARDVVLGAWGCGVFRNDPETVADAFGRWLESPRFRGAFDRVVFGIYGAGLPGQVSLEVFRRRFA